MTTRREVFPLLAGAAGVSAAAASHAAAPALSEPELRRVSYQSARTGKERDYFVYLPRGFAQAKHWPVMLFLHGDGERGDAKGELDYVLVHGPLFEAWCQRRDLPFVIISPQLDKFSRGEVPYIKYRDADADSAAARRLASTRGRMPGDVRLPEPMQGAMSDDKLPDGPRARPTAGTRWRSELLAMVDRTIADFKGDREARLPHRPELRRLRRVESRGAPSAEIRRAGARRRLRPPRPRRADRQAKLPLWVFAGGRDPVVPLRYFYPVLNKLEALGHPEVRFTIEEDLGHLTWVRVYEGQDIYAWFLKHSRARDNSGTNGSRKAPPFSFRATAERRRPRAGSGLKLPLSSLTG